MKTIWKFPLLAIGLQPVEMPAGADILCAQSQGDTGNIWACVDDERPLITRVIRVAGTGHELPPDETLDYIGTFKVYGDSLVFHVFEVKP